MNSIIRLVRLVLGTERSGSEPVTPVNEPTTVSTRDALAALGFNVTMHMGAEPAEVDIRPDHVATGTGKFYVYVHRDSSGRIFYVGKGTARRAWSDDRHPVWHHYVSTRSDGNYDVQIVSYHETDEEALHVENTYISRYGLQICNWINPHRQTDFAACDRYWAAKKANQKLVAETKLIEGSDPELAIERYRQAMLEMHDYESIVMERGLLAELTAEIFPSPRGDDNILDRLTLCLFQLRRYEDLNAAIADYQSHCPREHPSDKMKAVLRRQQRANDKRRN